MAGMVAGTSGGLRARVRAELVGEIKAIAVRQLATSGADLSLRAIARELGMASSALYRYFDSRDALLTALIIDGYAALGRAVQQADARCARRDVRGRFLSTGRALRAWAVANPAEYALLYGSPVPGYHAPPDTLHVAALAAQVVTAILRDAQEQGRFADQPPTRLPRQVRADLCAAGSGPVFHDLHEPVVDRALAAWMQIFGLISFELFGHLTGTITDPEAYFNHRLAHMATDLGLTS